MLNSIKRFVDGGHQWGDSLYICRYYLQVSLGSEAQVNGKLHNSRCWIGFNGREHSSSGYEILKYRYL
jgi:hypothetical protein